MAHGVLCTNIAQDPVLNGASSMEAREVYKAGWRLLGREERLQMCIRGLKVNFVFFSFYLIVKI